MALNLYGNALSTVGAQSATGKAAIDANTPHQPYWGDTGSGAPGYQPADGNALGQQGKSYDPNWAAPLSAWSEWDTATVGGLVVPGIVSLRVKKIHRVDKKMTPGADGASPTLLGFIPAEIDMTFKMWTRLHQQQYESLINLIMTTLRTSMAGTATQKGSSTDPRQSWAFDVVHPALKIAGIDKLYFERMTLPERASEPQVMQATLAFVEFYPIQQNQSVRGGKGSFSASNANGTVFGGGGAVTQPTDPSSNTSRATGTPSGP